MISLKLKESGLEMPVLGLGTAKASGDSLAQAVTYAIQCGYRHFDCAWLYGNEEIIGQTLKNAINESNGQLKRKDFFITSKVWYTYSSKVAVRKSLEDSLRELQVDYLDLYYLQWPMQIKEGATLETSHPYTPADSDVDFIKIYKNMEELLKEGKIKNIGLSNFSVEMISDILHYCDVKPVANQVEIHPYLQNEEMIEFCKNNEIILACYGTLGAGEKTGVEDKPHLLENEVLRNLGKKHKKTAAQVCLRWAIQRGLVVLPKSVTPARILENSQVFDFELSEEEMTDIRRINQKLSVYSVDKLKMQVMKPEKHYLHKFID